MRKGSMKRVLSLVLSFILVLSMAVVAAPEEAKAASEAGMLTIKADKTELKRGDSVTITVEYTGNTKAGSGQFDFYYDADKLDYVSYELGDAAKVGVLASITPNPQGKTGVIKAGLVCADNILPNGTLFTATFNVKDTAKGKISTYFGGIIYTLDGDADTRVYPDYNNLDLKVIVPLEGITLDKTSLKLAKGASEKLTATLEPADAEGEITWTSSNNSVATVSTDGTVTAVDKGTAKITATAGGKSASCDVTVHVPLESIQISADRTTIKKGDTLPLTVKFTPEDTTDDKTVAWTSDNTSVATVDNNGTVIAVADGTATITATVGTHTATIDITVQEVKLTGISLDKSAMTIHRGEQGTLGVTYTPDNTTDDRTVTWESSDEEIVTVDGSGNVTAKKVGSATITATVGNFNDSCTVTVDAPLKSIVPAEFSVELVKNQTRIITYKLNPEDTTDDKTVTFKSSDEEVAEVAADGTVTAKKAGNAVITLAGANDITATVNVTVTEIPINEVILDKTNAVVEKGSSTTLTATVKPDDTTDGKTITWESSAPSIVTVAPATSTSGQAVTVTATDKGGTATITAKAENGTTAVCEITVPIHLESIALPQDITLNRKDTKILDVTFNPEDTTDDKTVTWKSSDEEVASVDPVTGMIMGIKEGTATITATAKANSDITATTTVSVKEKHFTEDIAKDLKFEDMKEPLLKGQKIDGIDLLNLFALLDEHGITDDIMIEWISSDEEVAAFDGTGVLVGLKEGKTEIKAIVTTIDGSGKEYGPYEVPAITVEVKEIPLDSIAFNKVIKEMKVGEVQELAVIYNPNNTTDDRTVTWKSSDETVISVKDGKLTALKDGVAEITATVGGKSVTCKITVTENTTGNGSGSGKDSISKDGIVKTADTANITLYLMLMIISIGAMFCVLTRRMRRVRR